MNLKLKGMKKLAVFVSLFFVIFLSVNAQKTNKVFVELTRTMSISRPMETVKSQNITVSYWKIENGGFYYLTAKQEFRGKYKSYNFISKCDSVTILGIDKKKKRIIEKELLSDIMSSQ